MANFPESRYVDPTGTSSSTRLSPYAGAGPSAGTNGSVQTIEQLILLLNQPEHREEAVKLLNQIYKEKASRELPLLLWNSTGTVFILLQEVLSAYRKLSPPELTQRESHRICNILALFQCIAANLETRMPFIKAKMPLYIYPLIHTTAETRMSHYEHIRLTGLGVIGSLVKLEDDNTPGIVRFLLETEVYPLCLQCMGVGSELSKTVAAFIISKILKQELGQFYCCTSADRVYALATALSKIVEEFSGMPSMHLLKHVLTCYQRLSELPRARDVLKKYYPAKLQDPNYLQAVFGSEPVLRRLADRVRMNIIVRHKVTEEHNAELVAAFGRH